MSVQETSELLGICDSCVYDLIKKKLFKVMQIDNQTRVDKASFDAWYQSQTYYRTVADRKAEQELYKDMISMPELVRMLGVHRNIIYYLVRTGRLETIGNGRTKLVKRSSFEHWYRTQTRYKKLEVTTMASIVKRKSKFSMVYTCTDENGVKRQKWETFATNAEDKKSSD